VPPPSFYPEPPRWSAPPPPLRTYAGFWIRFLAWFIDSVLAGFAYGLPISILFPQHGLSTCPQLVSAGMCASSTPDYYLLARTWPDFVLTLLYFVLTWWLIGGTLGQHLLGLRVVDATTGARISLRQSIGRFFGYLLSIWVLCLGLIWAGVDIQAGLA
jgi:RDD family